ncbi:hypothetical protein E8E11_006352 [Didymella keratinophila]|nr:hypothetical protein E8E11_006352 [Didymella keratinophila]
MPFLDIFMISFATKVRNQELARRQARQDQIRECLRLIGTMYMREPLDLSRRQRYWDTYVSLRCLLIELAAEKVVCEFMFGWAQAYLEVMPLVQDQDDDENETTRMRRATPTMGHCCRQAPFGENLSQIHSSITDTLPAFRDPN